MAKRVAVVGAGCTGLAAIKSCVEENLAPTCFESSHDLGGLWRFTDDVTDARGCVMNSTVINTSKEMMSYSDFPPPPEFPNFMHHTKVLEYFRMYAKRFDLLQYIHFNSEVLSINQCSSTNIKTTADNLDLVSQTSISHAESESRMNGSKQTANHINSSADTNNTTTSKTQTLTYKAESHPDSDCGFQKQNGHRYDQKLTQGTDTEERWELVTSERNSKAQSPGVKEPTGQWEIKVKDKQTAEVTTHLFDYVLICTGHHAEVNMPYFPGQSIFKGKVLHSRDLRRANEIEGSRHVVVGIGNSGCDAAVELSRRGQALLSTRRGTWLLHRLQDRGLPADIVYMSRLVFATALSLPMVLLNKLTEWQLNHKVDHSLYGLRPRHGPFATHPTVNDELPNRIASGHVVVKGNVESFTSTGVRFEDGSEEDNIDTVVMATGYKINFPFLDKSVLSVEWNQSQLFLYMFPPKVTPPTLAVIGCIQPGGAVGPVSEMQCRLATQVFKGQVELPSKYEMLQDMDRRQKAMRGRYIDTQRHTIQVDYVPYMDELGSLIGCKPALGQMFWKDPRLAWTCVFGPCTPYQYRLQGPGVWPGAREAILTQMDRVKRPFATRQQSDDVTSKLDTGDNSVIVNIVLVCFFIAVIYTCVFLILAV